LPAASALFAPFIERFERLGVPYMVTGSTAGILYGEPRLTNDVDIVAALRASDVPAIAAAFPIEDFYCPPEEVLTIEIKRGQRGHFNLLHHESGFKADVYVACDELHRWALARRTVMDLDGLRLAVAPVEYVIVRKLSYFAEGGSDKHLRDIRGMLEVSRERIDRGALDAWVQRLGLASAWARVAETV
jgi:hypothetical protein